MIDSLLMSVRNTIGEWLTDRSVQTASLFSIKKLILPLQILHWERDKGEQKQLKDNQTNATTKDRNLTNLNNKLSSDQDNDNVTRVCTVLESKNTKLTSQIQQLETEKSPSSEQMQ